MLGHTGCSAVVLLVLVAHSDAYTGAPIPCARSSRSRPALALQQLTPDEVLTKRLAAESQGTLLGATALVAGTTVGAGVLALPAKTLAAGFVPSSFALFLCWVYMAASGLLIAEVNVNTLCSLEREAVSITSMAEETIGEASSRLCGVAYVFIHYSLLVAYFLQGGTLLLELLPSAAGAPHGALLFAVCVGLPIALSSPQLVEKVNSALVGGVVFAFGALLLLGVPQVEPELLWYADVPAVPVALPVMILSLVYHNVVPTICYQLGCNLPRIRIAVLAGSALPALLFFLWNGIILGSVPPDAANAAAAEEVFDPLVQLRATGGTFGELVRAFSLLAIVTSTVGFVYGLVDFFADIIDSRLASAPASTVDVAIVEGRDAGASTLAPGSVLRQVVLFGAVFVPPLLVAESDPSLFFTALDYAGAFGILSLFGIVPAAMAWQQRYSSGAVSVAPPSLPGGRVTLAGMSVIAIAIMALEVNDKLLPLFLG